MDGSTADRLILVIADNPTHVHQIQTAFQDSEVPHHLVAIASVSEAIAFLRRQGDYSAASRPDLILLDLHLPDKHGRELLLEIKGDPKLRRIPIIVLTTSMEEDDILDSYALQGNCYVIKSSDLEQLFRVVKRIEEFWFGIVTLPVE